MPQYATVMFAIPSESGFTYQIPQDLEKEIREGVQVIVPFGKKHISGIVIKIDNKTSGLAKGIKIKKIHDLVSPTPFLTRELIMLLEWISEYYLCQLGEAFRLIQSSINVSKSELMVKRLSKKPTDELSRGYKDVIEHIPVEKEIPLKEFSKKVKVTAIHSKLIELEKKGFIERRYTEIQKKSVLLTEDFFRLGPGVLGDHKNENTDSDIAKDKKSKAYQLIEYLKNKDWVSAKELKSHGFLRQILNSLLNKSILEKKVVEKERIFKIPFHEKVSPVVLTNEQSEIINGIAESLNKSQFATYLLHGITGSGKTQIYIELIKKVLALGKQAIVLIPEIVLTPQIMARFQYYFPDQIAVIHSRLSAGEKREVLYMIRQGRYNVVLGPRSAIFAPVNDLGLVIVDEEHEASYKQSDAKPRYHGRNVAIYRARLNNAVVVLGSATPSFESLYNVHQGVYMYYHLGKRIQSRNLPRINIVDLREEWKKTGMNPVISDQLELKVESRVLTKEQIMMLQNRRGYSPYIMCKDCGFLAKCQNCDITLTYHRLNRQLMCHYCGHMEEAPDVCPNCQGLDIIFKGIGTQKIEEVLKEKFPDSRILRMDQDTVKGKYGHATILEKFRNGAADILLGTKMIAKGLDFQKVTLVGIISADQGMHFPDFRASEKVFQLLTQAAGRAGRGGSTGEVVVQTFDPSQIIFKYLVTHDYLKFYEKEIQSRKNLKYPPFSRLILIKIEGKDLSVVQDYSQLLARFLWKANEQKFYSVLGPAPSPISRIQNVYRYQILLKQDRVYDAQISYIRKLLKKGILNNSDVKKWPVKIIIDVDPIEIL